MDKYDRQLRLWSTSGQRLLSSSAVCAINPDTAITEALKSVILPGVSSVTIVDPRPVTDLDLMTNFFLCDEDIDLSLSERLAANLATLNSDVSVSFINDRTLENDLLNDDAFWLQFDCIVYRPSGEIDQLLSDKLWSLKIPTLRLSSIRFYAYLNIQLDEHTIIETHEKSLEDLRLDSPWPDLNAYLDSVDINPKTNPQYYEIPYSLILMKLSQTLTNPVKLKELRNEITSLFKSNDALNVEQAYNNAHLIMRDSNETSSDMDYIFNNESCTTLSSDSPIFWILCNSLKAFIDEFGTFPVSGILPDMEASTVNYNALRDLYKQKHESDKLFIKNKTIASLNSLNRSPDELSNELLTTFVKNSRYLKVIHGSKWHSHNQILSYIRKENLPNSKSLIYLAFMIAESFYHKYKKFPSINDTAELRTLAISILCIDNDLKSYPEGLEDFLDELARGDGFQMHNIAAIIGGMAAQEIIKLLTHQFVPLDNTVVFDGITDDTTTLKLE